MKKTCAIVVTYNVGENYYENFAAIINQVDKVIIIDNGSSQATIDILNIIQQQNLERVEVIYNQQNIGLAAAQNIGIELALDYEWVLLLDHDSRAKEDMVEILLNAYNDLNDNKIAILAANPVEKNYPDTENLFITTKDNILFQRTGFKQNKYLEVIFAIASGSLIKSEIFKELGYFREDFFIDYVDTEFCLRVINNNYKIFAVKDAIIYHQLGEKEIHYILNFKIITTNHSPFRRFYIFRNRIKVWKLYFNKVPAFILFDFLAFFYNFIKIMLFEKQKLANLKQILRGIKSGILE